ncbi:MAG: tRNA (adenosine(37)-N6)-threonylcarbamoyltransferase complex transferase subunit TsaD [Candidatus Raymondbacteria bacterium RIFOXYA2_FULL_49_16]|uniref:tRNA N6-adenosine threonylcarbamoyltransferase n=1 Tax=Candidatus Raymondbacteria bacterium RIFOXYD12_FULL_49_13 TaxID=1817890 RepID=A0A1F7FEW7_UNCRA|nr:MAG: tRNA (adenosine(37)-N6)-threonylcarbamoyltransferase complex transferase subunit TsaD [Candidatus Raymondbacteria bacterium RIFOXYA2_FULL_49_16]OGK05234.1 MAG: tRNA (adenosine(37)-N6)-threonylcarbamoyltransferase complex transferase subunit TsaD [Candidatus Raymondbacteria bacterium RIFOXYD12_FULL_49_13]OGP43029.1 MAG: tRNA (adenosine(37)-N6)-threonylcarbamoyltransferase complex transferase subunit TsaD [Candidatus Raymondbacteria bacterium RIFOXYB2_FULL_49_35]
MFVLGIETSCDETSAAVITGRFQVLSNTVHRQEGHARFGGVVPEIASREHIMKIEEVTGQAIDEARIQPADISLVAATSAPGLIGALLVGLSFAKGFAAARDLPFVGVNHMDAHIKANYLSHPDLSPPYVALVVSGGHTFLALCDEFGVYSLLGNTLDDAAGEALDKAGKVMGIPYPAGRAIEQCARAGDPAFHAFPRALPAKDNLNFSFSGLKTALKNYLRTLPAEEIESRKNDILASYQEAVVDALAQKCAAALRATGCRRLLIAGGVSCNGRLRDKLSLLLGHENELYFPAPEFCTDNGAMVAVAGLFKYTTRGADPLSLAASAVFNIAEVNYGL